MPRHAYWELFYHFVWRTRDSVPQIDSRMEPLLYKYLTHRALETPEAIVHAVGGVDDHVHLCVSLPPTVQLSKWVGDIKGASSHEINHGPCGRDALAWQTGYGVVSFGRRDLPWVVNYVQTQREHHTGGRDIERLERITEVEVVDKRVPEGEVGEAR